MSHLLTFMSENYVVLLTKEFPREISQLELNVAINYEKQKQKNH